MQDHDMASMTLLKERFLKKADKQSINFTKSDKD